MTDAGHHLFRDPLASWSRVSTGASAALMALALSGPAAAQTNAPPPAPPVSASDPDMSPLPPTLSEKARVAITTNSSANPQANPSLPDQRTFIDNYQQNFSAIQRQKYAVDIAEETIAGVAVRRITAKGAAPRSKHILLNLHGGGFMVDAGSLTENIPVAALTGVPVIAVRYRLSPEHAFPAAVDDGLAVYRELLKTHEANDIGLYGTSAGAVLGSELLARIHAEGLPMPAVFGMFSGDADLSRHGDTILAQKVDMDGLVSVYLRNGPQASNPMVSPMRGELKDFPPTLCLASSRDFLLSDTADLCRALEKAGVENKFVMFDGLPHAFWAYMDAPESDEAFEIMARFFKEHFGK